MEDIQALKNKLFNKFGIALKEDDPAWLMILIYKELMQEVNNAINDLENIPKITTKNEEILKALSALQIEANSALEQSEKIKGNISTENKAFTDEIVSNINGIKSTVNDAVSNAVNGINLDMKPFENMIEDKLKKVDLSQIDNFSNRVVKIVKNSKMNLASSMTELDKQTALIQDSTNTLVKKTDTINDAVSNINSANKSLSMSMALAMLISGTVIGFAIATYFKIDAVSDFYFSQYETKQKKLETDQEHIKSEIAKLDKVSQILLESGSVLSYGTYNDTDVRYIEITNAYSSQTEYTFTRDGSAFIGLKE